MLILVTGVSNKKIIICDSIKYLGIYIDKISTFNSQIEIIKEKLSHLIGLVTQLRYFVSRKVLLIYYNYYVKPLNQYSILVYGGTYLSKLCHLAMFQRKLYKLIFFQKIGKKC